MENLPVYDRLKGGWVVGSKVVVPADTNLIGDIAEPWMHKIAALELGLGGVNTQEVISEVVNYMYLRRDNSTSNFYLDKTKIEE